MTGPIAFIDGTREGHVQRELSRLCSGLESAGIEASWHRAPSQALSRATLLAHDPVEDDSIPTGCRILGQRTLNRRQRLVLAEQCGLRVPRWCSLDSADQIRPVLEQWGVGRALYKADFSYQRKGVKLVTLDDPFQRDISDPDADVFMTILDGDPETLKIDIFFDQIIACRKTYTRSVLDPQFRRSFSRFSSLGEVPAIEPQLRALGRELVFYGAGLTSVDVMLDRDARPWVIELNTCSVGRDATWRRWPDRYIGGYLEGVLEWVAQGRPGRCGTLVGEVDGRLGWRSGGHDAPHVA